jgi:hypothetical protein
MEQMLFVNTIIDAARKHGYRVEQNKNGNRQITFKHKYLTDDDLRWLFQDIEKRKGFYTQLDVKELIAGRPCAIKPFFDLAVQADLCDEQTDGRKKIYRFKLS